MSTNVDALREALESYTRIDRCEDPIRTPLPNPEGYASKTLCSPCGKCRYCKAVEALAASETEPQAQVGEPDSFYLLFADAVAEGEKAMRKFPQPNYTLVKFSEEAGEVVKASVHMAEGRDTAGHVRDEMKQTIAMLYRLWSEGDQINGVPAISAMLKESL